MLEPLFSSHRKNKSGGKSAPARRALGFESLESREMLSVSPLTYPVTPEYDYRDSDWFEQIAENQTSEPAPYGAIESEWIVKLTDEALATLYSVSVAAEYFDDYGINVIGGLGSAGMLHVRMEGETAELQNAILASLDCLEFFEQNYAWENAAIADLINDTYVAAQWYLETLGVESAWNQTKGSGAIVAVIDTGIQLNQPDLQPNIWTNPGEIAGNGIDDDGNGFIDDAHGWNTDSNSGDVSATHKHGVMVAGVIGAAADNDYGIVGIAPDVKILPVKAGADNMTAATVIKGIEYVIKLKTENDVNVSVINLSVGGVCYMQAFAPSINAANEANILIVAGSGNSAVDVDLQSHYNNQYDNFITVAATDKGDNLSSFSNYGAVSVDLAAPGSNIYTSDFETGANFGLAIGSGTSASAPMVAGAAALIAYCIAPDNGAFGRNLL